MKETLTEMQATLLRSLTYEEPYYSWGYPDLADRGLIDRKENGYAVITEEGRAALRVYDAARLAKIRNEVAREIRAKLPQLNLFATTIDHEDKA